jgi:3-oxoacyl-[acyl-carrier protein] reductase
MSQLTGKVAIVTGASRGIGRAIALKLAQKGASIIVNYAGNAQKAQETVEDIKKLGVKAHPIQADVSKITEINKLFDQTIEQFGKVDILVNNAGINC